VGNPSFTGGPEQVLLGPEGSGGVTAFFGEANAFLPGQRIPWHSGTVAIRFFIDSAKDSF